MVAVGGCAVVVVGLGRATSSDVTNSDGAATFVMPTLVQSTYAAPPPADTAVPGPGATATSTARPATQRPTSAVSSATHPAPARHAAAPTRAAATPTTHRVRTTPRSAPKPKPSSAPRKPAVVHGVALPLPYSTGTATRVITVVASSHARTVATLQAWTKAPGGGWLRHGSAVAAHVGAQGLTSSPSETKSATPIGTFTLTQAFGRLANPGTGLPYFATTSADWWISQSGSLYNTHQHCSGSCPFAQGAPNEHLAYELPYYNYAVVIDANTRNAPGGVHQGRGSAFFLHVTDGAPTAGCVAIPQSTLVPIMRWLTPSAHPRILIGVA
jgi:L,D-peptidoglycan transpeptidase YkuD (ErfK/YbiS/YcfS/YnhG family)